MIHMYYNPAGNFCMQKLFFFFFSENYLLAWNRPVIQVGQQGRRRFEGVDSNPERLDHQLALIAQSVEHRWVRFPLRSIRFFNLSMSLCDENFFVGHL